MESAKIEASESSSVEIVEEDGAVLLKCRSCETPYLTVIGEEEPLFKQKCSCYDSATFVAIDRQTGELEDQP